MRKQLTLLIAVLGITCAYTQQDNLTIEYNLFEDIVIYKKNNEIIEKPFIKKGENINVIVTEFNPYTTKATIEVDQLGYRQSSQFSDTDKKKYKKSKDKGLIGGDLSLGEGLFSVFSAIPGSRGAEGATKEVMMAKSRYSALSKQMKAVESKMSTYQQKVALYQNAAKSKALALTDINNLKLNNNIRPSRIREMMEEEVMYAFSKTEKEKIEIDDLISVSHKEREVETTVDGYNRSLDEYEGLSKEWSAFNTGLKVLKYEKSDKKMAHIVMATDSISKEMQKNLQSAEDLKAEDITTSFGEDNMDDMANLRQIYEELQSPKSFQYSFSPIQAQGDEVIIDITFSQKDSDGDFEPMKKLTQTVSVSGHWKVSGSVGVAFGKFSNNTFSYSVIDDKITETPSDDFLPQVVSFVHMIKQTPKSLDLGISLGVGLPLLNGGETTSAAFFLGPTALIGHSQRVMISGGVMGAKASRLSGGFNAGDTFESPAEVLPITSKYELGYFIGISFSIL